MKKIFSTFCSIFIVGQLFSQSYDHVLYKQDFETVYSLAIDSLKYKDAIKVWNELENKYNSELHTEEHILKAYCYDQLGKKDKAAKCVREAWHHQLCDPAYLKQIDKFKWEPMVESFSPKQMKWVEQGYDAGRLLYSKDYDSLSYLVEQLGNSDQRYRSFITENDKQLDLDSLRKLSVEWDSLDILEFLRIYDKYGFPGEKVSVIFSQRLLVFMLHFADYEWFYTKMYPLFEADVKAGRMPASLFLMWIDRHSASNKQKAEYAMYQNPHDFNPTPEDIEVIKRKRFEMGVSKLFRIPFDL
ncbi:hypothetical protein [Fluviicola sp.]|uniref:hypothetical protein n=1 Tax=Fluviicola sp. TaxID=1917219 RepID=UPI00282793EB|nr:hypothetical protein [Fluviicola sp.]MDR0803251.1 hypothetical protein [Fluviicola sp.]